MDHKINKGEASKEKRRVNDSDLLLSSILWLELKNITFDIDYRILLMN